MRSGDIVEFAYPGNGYTIDQQQCARLLKEGRRYAVKSLDVHSWSTDVELEEFPGETFNSVMFRKVEP
jgi:hypothetical protein